MKYERVEIGRFVERPNRFIAKIEIDGKIETVHVKNTGRCEELLIPGVEVYLQKSENPQRKTQWDLIGVKKGKQIINMDSQIPNIVVKEWIEEGNFLSDITKIKPETTYGNSRFDLYVETKKRKIFIEVKGVTLEENGVVRFPDAPTERGVKHLEELCKAVKDGYEAYIFFVVQMSGVKYFTPNIKTHKEFGDALKKAKKSGVNILAYDCEVRMDYIKIQDPVPVILENPALYEIVDPIVLWYRKNKRQLPWREEISAYRVWVSEIMLQQTRVEAVKSYYERFLKELPTVKDLAEAEEEKILKLWEGLGYYNRVKNMQKAAIQIMEDYGGKFPDRYEEILSLTGIGSYTAGAVSSFAYGIPKAAVDGNVLRVVSRLLLMEDDIAKVSVRKKVEQALEEVIPKDAASDFNQGLIELGAMVCVPNGKAKCDRCPIATFCKAKKEDCVMDFPVKSKAKERKKEKRTILIFKDGETVAIRKRPKKGLLSGLYELPGKEGHLTNKEVIEYSKEIGLSPIYVEKLDNAKHIFSHIEWDMTGYLIKVDELEKSCTEKMIFANSKEIQDKYPIPSAFEKYIKYAQKNVKK